jgi:hypothetical protein
MHYHMEVTVDCHAEPCGCRNAATMQEAVQEEVWTPGVTEEGREASDRPRRSEDTLILCCFWLWKIGYQREWFTIHTRSS